MKLKLEQILQEKQIEYRLIKLQAKAYTTEDVVTYSLENINPDDICKTIILKGKRSRDKFAVLLRGKDKIDFGKAKKIFGEDMTIASALEVKEASGVEPGAVCPFLLTIPLFIDGKVLVLEKINCGSGDHFYGLEFSTPDLSKGLSFETISISKSI